MKRFIVFFFFLLLPAICFADPGISFKEEVYDAGTVNQGETVRHVFEFSNSGDSELLIQNVKAT